MWQLVESPGRRVHRKDWNRLIVAFVASAAPNVTIQQGPVLRLGIKPSSDSFTGSDSICSSYVVIVRVRVVLKRTVAGD